MLIVPLRYHVEASVEVDATGEGDVVLLVTETSSVLDDDRGSLRTLSEQEARALAAALIHVAGEIEAGRA